jgi:hypothetical protein
VSMWIDTGSSRLPDGTEEKLREQSVVRVDRSDHVWINLDTGAALVLACSGGWRTASRSGFQVFLRAPGGLGQLLDVTFGLIGTTYASFDGDQEGSATYSGLYRSLVAKITEAIGAQQNWNQGSSLPVTLSSSALQ